MTISGIIKAHGLEPDELVALEHLLDVWRRTRKRNASIESYYEGDVMVKDIGVDILPPDANLNVDLSCDWPAKAVDGLANLIRFRGFVSPLDEMDASISELSYRQNIVSAYNRNVLGELKKGCMFATVNRAGDYANIRFHGADSAAAIWDVERERIACGFVIADSSRTSWSKTQPVPVKVNLHMPGKVVVITRESRSAWYAERYEHPLDRPLMEAFVYKATDTKPLGSSRITKQVRDLVDDVLRVRLAMAVSTAFYAVPQKALMGLTPQQFDAMKKSKWATYVNSVLLTTRDRQGNVPQLQQLPSNSPQALIDIIRADASLFSGATGIPLNSLGIVQDNPSSAEAIETMRRDLAEDAESAIESASDSLTNVARMVMAVENNTTIERLGTDQLLIAPRFANPRMPTASAAADLAVKLTAARPTFAETDVFLEMQGFDAQTIERIKSQEAKGAGVSAMASILGGGAPMIEQDEDEET